MKWKDFFANRFGISMDDEMDTAAQSLEATDLENSPVTVSTLKSEAEPTIESNPLQSQLDAALAEVASLKESNRKLVQGLPITSSNPETLEEKFYSLYGGGRNGNKEQLSNMRTHAFGAE